MTDQKNQEDDFNEKETLIEFPARFPIKVMGKNTSEFQSLVLKIANDLIPQKDLLSIDERPSKNGRFLSMTITAMFYDKPAIDAVYMALTAHPEVLMAL